MTITYWKTIQAHALLPAVDEAARDALVRVAGLASASTAAPAAPAAPCVPSAPAAAAAPRTPAAAPCRARCRALPESNTGVVSSLASLPRSFKSPLKKEACGRSRAACSVCHAHDQRSKAALEGVHLAEVVRRAFIPIRPAFIAIVVQGLIRIDSGKM